MQLSLSLPKVVKQWSVGFVAFPLSWLSKVADTVRRQNPFRVSYCVMRPFGSPAHQNFGCTGSQSAWHLHYFREHTYDNSSSKAAARGMAAWWHIFPHFGFFFSRPPRSLPGTIGASHFFPRLSGFNASGLSSDSVVAGLWRCRPTDWCVQSRLLRTWQNRPRSATHLIDATLINPSTPMPRFLRSFGLRPETCHVSPPSGECADLGEACSQKLYEQYRIRLFSACLEFCCIFEKTATSIRSWYERELRISVRKKSV